VPVDWKRSAIWGASFGVAAVLVVVAALGLFHWNSSRPKSWDASTIKGVSSTVTQTFTINEKENKLVVFAVALEREPLPPSSERKRSSVDCQQYFDLVDSDKEPFRCTDTGIDGASFHRSSFTLRMDNEVPQTCVPGLSSHRIRFSSPRTSAN
jgi:hypothetical protein